MIKQIFKKIIFFILTVEAQIILWRYNPKIVAVTGTVGKTATKDAIFCGLSTVFYVRKNHKSLNSEIGVPLTILGLETGWNDPIHWLKNIFFGFIQIFKKTDYPKWLVLEVGVDQPEDMKKTASWLKPDIAVVTAFAKVPSHVENFDSPEDVMKEEASLIKYLKPTGILILNHDDEDVLKLKNKSNNKVYTYGITNGDITASNYDIVYEHNIPKGISLKVNYAGSLIPIKINGIIGDQFIYPILSALSVGVAVDASIVEMSTALSNIKFAPGRMNLLKGKDDSVLIDDTYNSSPIAVVKAIEALKQIKTDGLKIAVLGDILEIGHFSASEHRKVGRLITENKIDVLIAVGMRSQSTIEQALEDRMAKRKVFHFKTSEEAIKTVKKFLKPQNVILIKGSQGIRMEKITKELLADPDLAKELLVRQEAVWQKK